MNQYKSAKQNFYFIIALLCILSIGIGYAALTENLNVDQAINYVSMKWDVGFIEASDNGGTITSTSTISDDKKSISINCNIGMTSESQTCITKAKIKNDGTFNLMLDVDPTITFDSTYVKSATLTWISSRKTVLAGDLLGANSEKELQIIVVTKQLTKDLLLSSDSTIPIKLSFNWVETNLVEEELDYQIGQEIKIGTEKFNIISEDATTVTMLAQYNLGTDYRQTTTENEVTFSNTSGWEYTAEKKEIDIQLYDGNAKTYVNNYVSHLQEITRDTTLTGNLISLTELKAIGCTINDDYSYTNGLTCLNSIHSSWIINGQLWYTRSPYSIGPYDAWVVTPSGGLSYDYLYSSIRPVITVSKETLEKSFISFKIGDETYYAEEGMTWGEWVDTVYNTGGYFIKSGGIYIYCDFIIDVIVSDFIVEDAEYSIYDTHSCSAD